MTQSPAGSSPVFRLAQEIAASPFLLAPEKRGELLVQMPKLLFDYKEPKFVFRTDGKFIRVSGGALNLLWCASYAYHFIYQAYARAQKARLDVVRLGMDQESIEALNLYEWALRCVKLGQNEPWPRHAPQPTRTPEHQSAIHIATEVFLMTVGWILLHEIGHIRHHHPLITSRDRAQEEEHEADAFATDHVLNGISDPVVLFKRAMGIAVANIILVTVDLMQGSSDNGTHPRAEERLNRNLRRRQLAEAHSIHAFVTALLQVHLTKYGVPHSLVEHDKFDSFVDDFCLDLSRFRQP